MSHTLDLLLAAWRAKIREPGSELQTLQTSVALAQELIEQMDDAQQRLEKYDAPNPKCNAGHVNNLPLKLWNCPQCTDHHSKENVEMKIALHKISCAECSEHDADCEMMTVAPGCREPSTSCACDARLAGDASRDYKCPNCDEDRGPSPEECGDLVPDDERRRIEEDEAGVS